MKGKSKGKRSERFIKARRRTRPEKEKGKKLSITYVGDSTKDR